MKYPLLTSSLLAASSAHAFFGGGGFSGFATETTQIAFRIQDDANHGQVINQWQRNYSRLTEQLDVETDMRDWIGNPFDVELPALEVLSVDDFLNDLNYGISWEIVITDANGADSLEQTHNGLFETVETQTVTGGEVEVDDAALKKHAAVDDQYRNFVDASTAIDARLLELQENQALTLEELNAAETDAEVQKLAAIVNAQNGQIALLISEREKQYQQYMALKELNDNQSEKVGSVSLRAQFKDQDNAYKSVRNYLTAINGNQDNAQ